MTPPHLAPTATRSDYPNPNGWVRARDSAAAIIGWLVIAGFAFWALGHVAGALLLLVVGSLIAYVLSPIVDLIARTLPRWLAITVVYLALLALLGTAGYFIANTAVTQLQSFAAGLPALLRPHGPLQNLIYSTLHQLGVTDQQITAGQNQLVAYLQGVAKQVATQAFPILTGVANALLDVLLIVVISVYMVADGPRLVHWLTHKTPISQRTRVRFAMELMDHTVGGYVRGELFLASLIGLLVGTGMYLFQLPYAILLGVLALVFEFIPFLGVFISGAACVLVALTHGFAVALGVLAFFVLVHVIEGDVVGPRVIGKVLGLHPVVAILALIIGADLFGLWGALVAAPVAGVIQALLVALWTEWRESHPDEFPAETQAGGSTEPDDAKPPARAALFRIGTRNVVKSPAPGSAAEP
jgi:predicted PurR-regulated permease PerM